MNRNVRLYGWYYSLSSFLTWLPIFFLYFDDYLSLREIILLEALYYISVVILEVPTGYFSDVLGRKITLLIGAVLLCFSIVLFMAGDDFTSFAFGQLGFAGFMAFTSGTNTVFHYESLKDNGLEHEYGDREAAINRWALLSGGLAAMAGGIIGHFSLKAAYGLSLVAAAAALIIVLFLREPENSSESSSQALHVAQQVKKSLGYLSIPLLRWIFFFNVGLFSLIHIPYEFYQPYLDLLDRESMLWGSSAPIVSGMLYALTRFVSALVAGKSMIWARKVGFFPFFIFSMAMIITVIGLLGSFLHPVLIGLILFRGASWAAVKAPVNSIITPSIDHGQRATFHSVMSLFCRLAFFISLYGLSFLSGKGETTDWPALSGIFLTSFWAGIVMLFVVVSTGKKINFKVHHGDG